MISKRINQIRKESGKSQAEFGKSLGVSRDVISNIEYGRVEPKDLFIDHLCHIYAINKQWLLTGEGEQEDHNIESKKNVDEAIKIIETLPEELQEYAIEQLKVLSKLNQKRKQ